MGTAKIVWNTGFYLSLERAAVSACTVLDSSRVWLGGVLWKRSLIMSRGTSI